MEQFVITHAGGIHYGLNNYEYAFRYLDAVLPVLRRSQPPDEEFYLGAIYAWAATSEALGRAMASIPVVEDAVARAREAGCNSELLRKLEEYLSVHYSALGHGERTRLLLEKGLDDAIRRFGRESRESVEAMTRLGFGVELPAGNVVRATALLSEALFIVESNRGAFWAEMVRFSVFVLAGEIAARTGDREGEVRFWARQYSRAESTVLRRIQIWCWQL